MLVKISQRKAEFMTILRSLAGASAGWEKKVLPAGVEERFGDPIPSSDRCLLQFIWTAVFLRYLSVIGLRMINSI